jgi:hypothetical protein
VASETELRRRRLVRMLVREPALEPSAIEAAAAEAEWELPRRLAVLAVSGKNRGATPLRLPPGTLAETIGDISVAVLPDPEAPGRLSELERAVSEHGALVAVGTTVDWHDAAVSFARARAALELVNGSAEAALIVAREHIGELMLRSDARLADELASDRLAPLGRLSPGSRARMVETLRCWLAEQGRIGPMAERLGVHPQTARYRLSRLRDVFGSALEDPDERFWLELALRVGGDPAMTAVDRGRTDRGPNDRSELS